MAYRSLTLALAAAVLMAACSPGSPVSMAMADVPRASNAPSADSTAVATSMEALGADLYGVVTTGDGNVVFSPASIMTALAMTYAGARGSTAEEMAQVLHIDLSDQAFHAAMNALDLALESASFREGDDRVELSIANSLWGQEGLTFEQPFLDTLASDYGTGIRLADFEAAAEDARVKINAWVADRTNDKITDLIPEGAVNGLTRLVLVNAVYLDATWARQFDPNHTSDGTFTTLAGDTVTVPMMSQTSTFGYAKGDGWQAVDLPYSGDDLSMLLIVPDGGRFSEVESRLESGVFNEALAGLSATSVSLAMPKFTVRSQMGLNGALEALGMDAAFDRDNADFSGMTTEERLFISEVVHEAYIAVDEEGTEAAAATGVVMEATSSPMVDTVLRIDRPFVFVLRDATGAILFLGRVADPSER